MGPFAFMFWVFICPAISRVLKSSLITEDIWSNAPMDVLPSNLTAESVRQFPLSLVAESQEQEREGTDQGGHSLEANEKIADNRTLLEPGIFHIKSNISGGSNASFASKELESRVTLTFNPVKSDITKTMRLLDGSTRSTKIMHHNLTFSFNMTSNKTSSQREGDEHIASASRRELIPTITKINDSDKHDQHSEEQKTKKLNRKLKSKKGERSSPSDDKTNGNKFSHLKKVKKSKKNQMIHRKGYKKVNKKKKQKAQYFPYFKDNYCPQECACYGRVVQCSDKGVDKIPYGIPYNARYMLLMNNKIDIIQLDLLNEYLSLEFLVLNNNRLTDSSIEGAFEGMEKLKRLYIEQNLLCSIPTDLPRTLEELRLNGNNISVMSEQVWFSCKNLHIVSLNNNSLSNESIPDGVFGSLTNLRTLSINNNYLMDTPYKLPTNLKELYLKGNQIERILSQMFTDYSDLIYLDLSNNQLISEGIDENSFCYMAKLENLNLGGNFLNQIPKRFPSALKTLNLEGNRITSVNKDAFLKMTNLEQLGLSKNKIVKVAAGAFKRLSALHHLDISYNNLLEVPRQLPATLHSVALNNNKIHFIPRNSFCGNKNFLSNLVLVHLEHNHIDMGNINTNAFRCIRGFQIVHFY